MTTLGKGLESLIPPKKNQSTGSDGSASASSQQAQQGASNSSQNKKPLPDFGAILGSALKQASSSPAGPTQSSSLPMEPEPVLPTEPAEILPTEPAAILPVQPAEPATDPAPADPLEHFPRRTAPAHLAGSAEAIFQIEVDKITANPHQPRRNFDEEGLRELASSIREFGVLQPIIVSKVETESETGTNVVYELIAGERRLLASRLAGLRTIPAIVRRLTPEREKLEIAIIENIQRQDLDPIEEAKAFARLQDEFRLTQREIAAKLGKSRETVANTVRLLGLPSDIQKALSERKISESQGRLLLSVTDIAEQQRMYEDILRGGMSVRELKSKIQKKKDMSSNEIAFVKPETLALKEKLEEFLGTKVDLKEEGDRGKITISFYSKEELKGIIEKLFKEGISH